MGGMWDLLGLEPSNDKREIKKAYARKSRLCHPEENPEEFDRLHQAYLRALEFADAHAADVFPDAEEIHEETLKPPEEAKAKPPEASAAKTDEQPDVKPARKPEQPMRLPGDRVRTEDEGPELSMKELIARGMLKELEANRSRLLMEIQRLHVKHVTDEKLWLELFKSPLFESTGHDPEFLDKLVRWLRTVRMEVTQTEVVSLYRGYHFVDYEDANFRIVPNLPALYKEIMFYAEIYEEGLAACGMKPVPEGRAVKPESGSGSKWIVVLMAVILFSVKACVGIGDHQERAAAEDHMTGDMEKMRVSPSEWEEQIRQILDEAQESQSEAQGESDGASNTP